MKGPTKGRKVAPVAAAAAAAAVAPKLAPKASTGKAAASERPHAPRRRSNACGCPQHEVLLLAALYVALTMVLLVATKELTVHFPRPVTLVTLKTVTSIVILLAQHMLGGPEIAAFRWEQAGYWEYTSFLHAVSRVTTMIVLFDARFPVACALHAAAALGFASLRRDSAWSVERTALALPVLMAMVAFAINDVAATGVGVAVPLLLVQGISVSSTWLLMREAAHSPLGVAGAGENAANSANSANSPLGASGGAIWSAISSGSASATADFYLAVGSVPLLMALFWWFGEHRALSAAAGAAVAQGGGALTSAAHLSAWHKALAALVCVADYARVTLAHKLLAVATPRFAVGADLVAMLVVLLVAGGHYPFASEAASTWGLFVLLISFAFVVLFVGADGGGRRARSSK